MNLFWRYHSTPSIDFDEFRIVPNRRPPQKSQKALKGKHIHKNTEQNKPRHTMSPSRRFLPDELLAPIARKALPNDAAKLRQMSKSHAYAVSKRDLADAAASFLWCTRFQTDVVHLWSRIYKTFPLLSGKPDIVTFIIEGLLVSCAMY